VHLATSKCVGAFSYFQVRRCRGVRRMCSLLLYFHVRRCRGVRRMCSLRQCGCPQCHCSRGGHDICTCNKHPPPSLAWCRVQACAATPAKLWSLWQWGRLLVSSRAVIGSVSCSFVCNDSQHDSCHSGTCQGVSSMIGAEVPS
jgi:hypothetical protein